MMCVVTMPSFLPTNIEIERLKEDCFLYKLCFNLTHLPHQIWSIVFLNVLFKSMGAFFSPRHHLESLHDVALWLSPPAAGVGVWARAVEYAAELGGRGGRGDRSHRLLPAPHPPRLLTCVGTPWGAGRDREPSEDPTGRKLFKHFKSLFRD